MKIVSKTKDSRAVGDALNGISEADNKIKIQAAGFVVFAHIGCILEFFLV